jgi:hypothetical protein
MATADEVARPRGHGRVRLLGILGPEEVAVESGQAFGVRLGGVAQPEPVAKVPRERRHGTPSVVGRRVAVKARIGGAQAVLKKR